VLALRSSLRRRHDAGPLPHPRHPRFLHSDDHLPGRALRGDGCDRSAPRRSIRRPDPVARRRVDRRVTPRGRGARSHRWASGGLGGFSRAPRRGMEGPPGRTYRSADSRVGTRYPVAFRASAARGEPGAACHPCSSLSGGEPGAAGRLDGGARARPRGKRRDSARPLAATLPAARGRRARRERETGSPRRPGSAGDVRGYSLGYPDDERHPDPRRRRGPRGP